MTVDLAALRSRYEEVSAQIGRATESAGRAANPPTLIAVGKFHPVEAIEALYHLGHRDFGENYVQELAGKALELERRGCVGIRWHFIGHLQSNKIKQLLPHLHLIHTVDSARLAESLARVAKAAGRVSLPAMIEVNVDAEASKAGVSPDDVPALARQIGESWPELSLEGLMCIPAAGRGAEPFRRLQELEIRCRPWSKGRLSMGMSEDFETAIAEGASYIRIGTAIFGPRPSKV